MNTATPLADADASDLPSVPISFEVRDEASANWVVRRVHDARAYTEKVAAWAAVEIRRAENEERWLLQRFSQQLEDWAREALRAHRCSRRSLALPAGRVGFRPCPAQIAIAERHAAAEWCRRHLTDALKLRVEARGPSARSLRQMLLEPQLDLVIQEDVLVGELKKHFDATGELPPGTSVVEATDRFFIR
jgi:hypothetical protein